MIIRESMNFLRALMIVLLERIHQYGHARTQMKTAPNMSLISRKTSVALHTCPLTRGHFSRLPQVRCTGGVRRHRLLVHQVARVIRREGLRGGHRHGRPRHEPEPATDQAADGKGVPPLCSPCQEAVRVELRRCFFYNILMLVAAAGVVAASCL